MTKYSIGQINAIVLVVTVASCGAALSGEAAKQHNIKPMAAVTFNAGSKHGVGYFLKEQKSCKLVLTMSECTDVSSDYTATRYETAIQAGSATSYGTSPGKALEFTCLQNAEAMSVREVERVVIKGAE